MICALPFENSRTIESCTHGAVVHERIGRTRCGQMGNGQMVKWEMVNPDGHDDLVEGRDALEEAQDAEDLEANVMI